jgi:hypothetical protein
MLWDNDFGLRVDGVFWGCPGLLLSLKSTGRRRNAKCRIEEGKKRFNAKARRRREKQ